MVDHPVKEGYYILMDEGRKAHPFEVSVINDGM